jgi:Domain of unknown function (DUF4157)
VSQFAVCHEGVRTSAVAPPAAATSIPVVSRSVLAIAPDRAVVGLPPSRVPASSSSPGAAPAGRLPLARPSQVLVGGAEKGGAVPRYTSPVLDVVDKAGGRPLDPKTRTDMEARLGSDFSDVRIHTGDKAAASAAAVSATAYTVGHEVVFGHGSFDPASSEGRHRLAHELIHVQQQRRGPVSGTDSGDGVMVSDPADAFEREAEETATRVVCGSQRVFRGGRASPVSADQADVAVIRERRAGVIQRQRHRAAEPVPPELITATDRIENAYGGSLDEAGWRNELQAAERAYDANQLTAAKQHYRKLYHDVASLAKANRVVRSSDEINVVAGSKATCKDVKPGLNLSLGDSGEWGANASTAFAYEDGKFDERLRARGVPQPEVGIVLSRSAFKPEKEQTLGFLRHEMIHAEILADDAYRALRSDPRVTAAPDQISTADQELLACVEGFMTMFRLTHPAPTSISPEHPAFTELLGALSRRDVFPWAWAHSTYKTEAVRQLGEYYCQALDREHREAFDGWVRNKLAIARGPRLEVVLPEEGKSPQAPVGEKTAEPGQGRNAGPTVVENWLAPGSENFFLRLQNMINEKCKGFITPMKP